MLATLWNGPGGTGFVFALLALISLGFLLRFVLPALILLRQLGRAVGGARSKGAAEGRWGGAVHIW